MPMFDANQAARIGEMGAGRDWGAMLAKGMLPTTTPAPRFGGASVAPGQPNPILSALGQTYAGGPSGLASGIGRYRPPSGGPPQDSFQNQIFNGLLGRMNIPAGGLAPPPAAAGGIGPNGATFGAPASGAPGRGFGDNPAAFGANQQLAAALPNFKESFGGGRFDAYMQGASGGEQTTAANILRALGQPGRVTWAGGAPPPAFNPQGPIGGGDSTQGPIGAPVGVPGGVGGNMDSYLLEQGVLQGGA